MRYALYYTPGPDDALSRAAAQWLGRDPHKGVSLDQPHLSWLAEEALLTLTEDPRRYGFHATLKAPFSLREDRHLDELVQHLARFAEQRAPVILPSGLKVSQLGPFFALVPQGNADGLDDFASACVRTFEPYRAPLSAADLQRRRKSQLTEAQSAYLEAWGYPYVFDAFRYHMTLTGPVPDGLQDPMRQELTARFSEEAAAHRVIESIALFEQPARDRPFCVKHIFMLKGQAKPAPASAASEGIAS
ncbi:MAG: DUF1045 domain-containing protein [Pseudomonadota bacterium]